VAGTGAGPLRYQWQFNGADLPGLTRSSLNASGIDYTNAGLYCAVVSGAGGSVTSHVAVVNILPILNIGNGSMITLNWAGPFILQGALNVNGPYLDKTGLTSPAL